MRYSFRLAEILGYVPDDHKRPGMIKEIAEETGLDRHQVSNLLKSDIKSVPLESLSKICNYLVEKNKARPSELPGKLFGIVSENLWALLANRRRVGICQSVRKPPGIPDWIEGASSSASDSLLLGEVLSGISSIALDTSTSKGSSKPPETESPGAAPSKAAMESQESQSATGNSVGPQIEGLKQNLVWAYDESMSIERVEKRAREVYEDYRGDTFGKQKNHKFDALVIDTSLVCLGSVKNNPVAELILADLFGCTPFLSEDHVEHSSRRSSPFFFALRPKDRPVPSFCAGSNLSRSETKSTPGIHYETASGSWKCLPWHDRDSDAALVIVIHQESVNKTEMILGGFSGRATRLLSLKLREHTNRFWPPSYNQGGRQVGMFLVKFEKISVDEPDDFLHINLDAEFDVVPMAAECIARRIKKDKVS